MSQEEHRSDIHEVLTPFVAFMNRCVRGLKLGQQLYGTRMFDTYDPLRLVREVREEIRDAVNYLFALDTQMEHIEKIISKAELTKIWESGE